MSNFFVVQIKHNLERILVWVTEDTQEEEISHEMHIISNCMVSLERVNKCCYNKQLSPYKDYLWVIHMNNGKMSACIEELEQFIQICNEQIIRCV